MVSIISVSALKRGLVGSVLPRDGSIENREERKKAHARDLNPDVDEREREPNSARS